MNTAKIVRVKVCCISSIEEAGTAIEEGASALGLVSEMPSGPGVISLDAIKKIASQVPPPIATFLLTSKQSAAEIIEQHRYCRTTTIQLTDRLAAGSYADLRKALPGVTLVQVIHVSGPDSVDEAVEAGKYADALLLDSGNPGKKVKELGGTGRIHNWDISRIICERAAVPVFLAGGITPENVKKAIEQVRPFGIDLCSGVRTDDKLDRRKLQALFAAAAN
jgi:phosphoribosylanthranilate isomerase